MYIVFDSATNIITSLNSDMQYFLNTHIINFIQIVIHIKYHLYKRVRTGEEINRFVYIISIIYRKKANKRSILLRDSPSTSECHLTCKG